LASCGIILNLPVITIGLMLHSSSTRQKGQLRPQVADTLRRVRKLPVGADSVDLRQLAPGLLWIEQQKFGRRCKIAALR